MRKIKDIRDKIKDNDVKRAYDKYQIYLLELGIYEKYINENGSDKINIFRLLSLYKKNGIKVKDKKNIGKRFKKFSDVVIKSKQKNPDVNLTDISTQKNREIVSDIIYETQNDEKFKTADLNAVAVIENFCLYAAVGLVDNNVTDIQRGS